LSDKKPKRRINPRRTFSVKTQLVAKYGDDIEAKLQAVAKPKRTRRRRPRRKTVTA